MSACKESCSSTGCTSEDVEATTESASRMQNSCVPLPLPEDRLTELVADARDYALLHGAGMRFRESYSVDTLSMAPFFLLPTPFPRRDFEKVYSLQPLINKLMHKVAHDHDFLEKCLRNTIKVDDFTNKLWEIYTTVRAEGVKQPVSLGLLRCDVILDVPSCDDVIPQPACMHTVAAPLATCRGTISSTSSPQCSNAASSALPSIIQEGPVVSCASSKSSMLCCSTPKQVEVNTIASSVGALAGKVLGIHKYILKLLDRHDLLKDLPHNPALQGLCDGMLAAWDRYNRNKAIILFVVEDVTYNICDQRFHEYEILEKRPSVKVVRRTLTQIQDHGVLDGDGRLWIKSQEVAVVYFRSGYDPSLYHGEGEWAARLMIERSLAIKCPSVHYHLAGTKKVQQELATKGALLQFLSPEEAQSVAELFTGLYTMDMGEEGDATVAMALAQPDRFVLKPQREGGGNNIYGQDIRTTLESIGQSSEREAFILMDRIRAPVQTNYLVAPQQPVKLTSVISELGIFGAILGSSDEIFMNETCGHMLRSKLSANNEGGVSSGNGALDSVLLVD